MNEDDCYTKLKDSVYSMLNRETCEEVWEAIPSIVSKPLIVAED